jgi:hypothetical protein
MELLLLDPTAGRTWARHFTACGGYERLCSCLLLRSASSSSDSSSISCSSMSPLQRQCLALVLRLVRAFVQSSDAITSGSNSGDAGESASPSHCHHCSAFAACHSARMQVCTALQVLLCKTLAL